MSTTTKTATDSIARHKTGLPGDGVVLAAEARLRKSAYVELRRVACEYHEGALTLHGRVSSYYLKQLAQSLVSELEGVLELNNQLDVNSSSI
jgi:osmotically-inducible protein OsmY